MFTDRIILFLFVTCAFWFCSCTNKNRSRTDVIYRDSSKITSKNAAAIDGPSFESGSIVVYDKNLLPQVIKDHYSQKWEGFNIANPNEDWDAGCSRSAGIVDSVDKNGIKHIRVVHIKPEKQLVCIIIDTSSRKYLVTYYQGGIGKMRISDYFRILEDGALETRPNIR